MNKLIEILKKDCEEWVSKKEKRLFMNERDMQVRLTKYLEETGHYGNVYMEYCVPLEMLAASGLEVPEKGNGNKWSTPSDFPWNNQMNIDIVVEKGGKFAAVELKYATASIGEKATIFGETVNYDLLKNKDAYNAVMYNYWKDVRRIEAVTRFNNVVGGVALIVSNAPLYWAHSGKKLARDMFSTHEGHTVPEEQEKLLKWNDSAKMADSYPAFNLDGSYRCHWEKTDITVRAQKNTLFRYMINVVEK